MQRAIRLYTLTLVSAAVAALVPTAAEAQTVPNVDLAIVSNTANVKHGHLGQLVTFTILATNNGPDTAPSLDVYDNSALQGLQVVEEICDLGISPDTPACEYSNVSPGQTLTTTVIAEIVGDGGKTASLTSCVQSEQLINDPNPGNACATATLKVLGKR
jgi:large repetitive protein